MKRKKKRKDKDKDKEKENEEEEEEEGEKKRRTVNEEETQSLDSWIQIIATTSSRSICRKPPRLSVLSNICVFLSAVVFLCLKLSCSRPVLSTNQ